MGSGLTGGTDLLKQCAETVEKKRWLGANDDHHPTGPTAVTACEKTRGATMPLLNYTTSVPVSRTISQIHGLLIEGGARSIGTNYDATGTPTGIAFATETPHGLRSFTLPVNTRRVMVVLEREGVPPRYRTPEHAQRVGWRIVKDWLEAQLAIIRTEMATLDQVMLPYMQSGDGRTVYELYREQQLAQLETGRD